MGASSAPGNPRSYKCTSSTGYWCRWSPDRVTCTYAVRTAQACMSATPPCAEATAHKWCSSLAGALTHIEYSIAAPKHLVQVDQASQFTANLLLPMVHGHRSATTPCAAGCRAPPHNIGRLLGVLSQLPVNMAGSTTRNPLCMVPTACRAHPAHVPPDNCTTECMYRSAARNMMRACSNSVGASSGWTPSSDPPPTSLSRTCPPPRVHGRRGVRTRHPAMTAMPADPHCWYVLPSLRSCCLLSSCVVGSSATSPGGSGSPSGAGAAHGACVGAGAAASGAGKVM